MMDGLIALVFVAIGGALGSMGRFWVSGLFVRKVGGTFPWGTLVVNVTGSAMIGVLAAVLLTPETQSIRHMPVWAGLVVGLLGSYTTVSSFSLQTLVLARNGETGRALINIVLSLALCLMAAAVAWGAVTHALHGMS